MEVGPLDAALLPKLNFALSTAFAVLTFIAWIFYCIISYSTKCYKDSFKAGYSFALVVVGFFLFQLPAAGLNACEFLGIAVPGLVEGGGAGAPTRCPGRAKGPCARQNTSPRSETTRRDAAE